MGHMMIRLHNSLIEFGLYSLVYFELKAPEVRRLDLFIIAVALKLTSVCLDVCSDALVHDGTALFPVRPTLVGLDLNQGCLTIWHCHADVFSVPVIAVKVPEMPAQKSNTL